MNHSYPRLSLVPSAIFAGLAALASVPAALAQDSQRVTPNQALPLTQAWDKTFSVASPPKASSQAACTRCVVLMAHRVSALVEPFPARASAARDFTEGSNE